MFKKLEKISDLDVLGKQIEPEMAVKIATGEVDPITKEPFPEIESESPKKEKFVPSVDPFKKDSRLPAMMRAY